MRVTTKGQVTIPEEIRHQFHIYPGSNVKFIAKNDKIYLEICPQEPSTSRFRQLKGIASVTMSTDEIMALTRGD